MSSKSPQEEVAELRAAIREAHETIQDLRAEVKAARQTKEEIGRHAQAIYRNVSKEVESTIIGELRHLHETLQSIADQAKENWDKRTDEFLYDMLDVLTGESWMNTSTEDGRINVYISLSRELHKQDFRFASTGVSNIGRKPE
jgi:DNA phosphorothioation-dependent restriction protein DptG